MFDLTRKESALAAVICGALAMILGTTAVLANASLAAGAAIGVGLWAIIYGIMAWVKKL